MHYCGKPSITLWQLLLLLPTTTAAYYYCCCVQTCGARVMSMDQIEGLEPIHENWGDVNLGEELDEGGGNVLSKNILWRTFLSLSES
jgi:hypothetical protein